MEKQIELDVSRDLKARRSFDRDRVPKILDKIPISTQSVRNFRSDLFLLGLRRRQHEIEVQLNILLPDMRNAYQRAGQLRYFLEFYLFSFYHG